MLTIPDFLTNIATPTPCRDNPQNYEADADRDTRHAAKRTCRSCPVMTACLTWAMERGERGVWGGLDDHDRQVLRRTGRLPKAAQTRPARPVGAPQAPGCGSAASFRRHARLGEKCEVCSAAHAEEKRGADLERVAREVHGTAAMYHLETRLGLEHCPGCKEWCRQKSARDRVRRRAERAVGASVASVVGEIAPGAQAGAQRFERVA